MQRQVGARACRSMRRASRRGMIIRHLVLPHGLSQTPEVLRWIARELSPEVMSA